MAKSGGRLSTLWTFLVFFLAFFRVGEASVPGPASSLDLGFEEPNWTLPTLPDFCIGTGNPSGINNKLHTLDRYPCGWFHLAETHASAPQQCRFQSYLRAVPAARIATLGVALVRQHLCVRGPRSLVLGQGSSISETAISVKFHLFGLQVSILVVEPCLRLPTLVVCKFQPPPSTAQPKGQPFLMPRPWLSLCLSP